MTAQASPASSPEYSSYREGVSAVDVMTNVVKKHGCNAYMYKYVNIQVVPDNGANPDVAVWWWSEAVDAFIQENTPIAKPGVGADTPYEFTIESLGRIFFVQVSAIATGDVNILVSGFERYQFS